MERCCPGHGNGNGKLQRKHSRMRRMEAVYVWRCRGWRLDGEMDWCLTGWLEIVRFGENGLKVGGQDQWKIVGLLTGLERSKRLKPRPHQRQCLRNRRHCRRNRQHCVFSDNVAVFGDNIERNFVLATMSEQIEHVQFVATLSHERATNCCRVSVYLFSAMS